MITAAESLASLASAQESRAIPPIVAYLPERVAYHIASFRAALATLFLADACNDSDPPSELFLSKKRSLTRLN